MKKIVVDQNVCRGCRLCRKACPFAYIKIYDGYAHIDKQCKGCQKCLKNCPFNAIRVQLI